MFGVTLRFTEQQSINVFRRSAIETSRSHRIVAAIVGRQTNGSAFFRWWCPSLQGWWQSMVEERDKKSGPKINNRFWLGLYMLATVNYLNFKLCNGPSHQKIPIYCRRLTSYKQRHGVVTNTTWSLALSNSWLTKFSTHTLGRKESLRKTICSNKKYVDE